MKLCLNRHDKKLPDTNDLENSYYCYYYTTLVGKCPVMKRKCHVQPSLNSKFVLFWPCAMEEFAQSPSNRRGYSHQGISVINVKHPNSLTADVKEKAADSIQG